MTTSILKHLTSLGPWQKKRKPLSSKSVVAVMPCKSETCEMMRLRPTQDVSKAKDQMAQPEL